MDFKSSLLVKPLVFFLVSFLVLAGFPFGSSTNLRAQDEKGSIVGVVYQREVISPKPGEEVKAIWPRIINPYQPIVGAEVKAINTETGETYISSKTDKYGIFMIEDLPAGEYKILVITEDKEITSDIVVKVEPNKQIPLPLLITKRAAGIFILLVGSAAALGYVIYKAVASPSEPG
ncbi:MAG: carboxypeptidase-like regulatory domain-containing protein [Candidatus Aminicenantes bacterium]|nr:carboxypeptidase-like regulatory domain-containing protein [Candidatus Aminicenantes bacterium]